MCPLTRHGRPAPLATTSVELDVLWAKTFKHLDISYGLNHSVYSVPQDSWLGTIEDDTLAWGTCQVKGASNIPVFVDCHDQIIWYHVDHDAGPPTQQTVGPGSNAWRSRCIDRHRGGINMLFMDWSVSKVGLKELWTLKWHRQFDTAGP